MKTSSRYGLLALFAILLLTGACNSSSNDSYEYTSNCSITSITLGKMKRELHTTSSTGNDSIYYITFNGSLYPLTIDQVNRKIFNDEAFPKGTQLKTVATIQADGLVVHKHESDTLWTAYSSSDSIDFTQPVLFRVYAYDGSNSYREYSIELNARNTNYGEFTWQQLGGISEMATRKEAKMLTQGTDVVVLSITEAGTTYCARSTSTDNATWTEQECAGLPQDADVHSTVCYKGQFWMNTAEGKLLLSSDGVNWTAVTPMDEAVGTYLVAASETMLHAAIHDPRQDTPYYMASSTDGLTWTPVPVEDKLFERPSAAVAYEQTNGNHRLLLCADVLDGDTGSLYLWGLLEDAGQQWMLMTDDNASLQQLPRWTRPILLPYNGWLVAFGDTDRSGQHTALDAIYLSYDNGLNWYINEDLTAPQALTGITAPIAAATVGEYIWFLTGDQLWRVRYNEYGD